MDEERPLQQAPVVVPTPPAISATVDVGHNSMKPDFAQGVGPASTLNGNNKRPLEVSTSTTAAVTSGIAQAGNDDAAVIEKRRKRLEKNRLSARECRRRKKEATEQMQHEINLLEGENLRLRLQLQVGEEAEKTNFEEQNKLTEGLDELLKSGASESEIYAKIEEYKEKFADYGRDRRSAIEFHLRNVERLLMPTQTTSVVLATLQGRPLSATSEQPSSTVADDRKPASSDGTKDASDIVVNSSQSASGVVEQSAQSSAPNSASAVAVDTGMLSSIAAESSISSPTAPPKDTKALFKHLVSILQVTPEQAAALKDSRFVAQEMDEILKEALGVLQELRTRLTQCGQDLETEFSNVRAILTPSQSAKFLVWVAQNKACIHLLNELWNKVYPTTDSSSSDYVDVGAGSGGEDSP